MFILANTITADMGLIPGFAFVGPALGLPLSVLAAFIERPFYSRAGVETQTIWYSLQANLVSLVIGFAAALVFTFIADAVHRDPFDIWPFFAVAASIVIERTHLQRRTSVRVSWAWTAAGNILSAGACVGLLYLILYLRPHLPHLQRELEPWNGELNLFAFIASAALFVTAFLRTRKKIATKAPPKV